MRNINLADGQFLYRLSTAKLPLRTTQYSTVDLLTYRETGSTLDSCTLTALPACNPRNCVVPNISVQLINMGLVRLDPPVDSVRESG